MQVQNYNSSSCVISNKLSESSLKLFCDRSLRIIISHISCVNGMIKFWTYNFVRSTFAEKLPASIELILFWDRSL